MTEPPSFATAAHDWFQQAEVRARGVPSSCSGDFARLPATLQAAAAVLALTGLGVALWLLA